MKSIKLKKQIKPDPDVEEVVEKMFNALFIDLKHHVSDPMHHVWLRGKKDKIRTLLQSFRGSTVNGGEMTEKKTQEYIDLLNKEIQLQENIIWPGDSEGYRQQTTMIFNFEKIKEFLRQQESLRLQIDKLANFIMTEVPGEPSQSEGAIDTAIRIIRDLKSSRGSEEELKMLDGMIIMGGDFLHLKGDKALLKSIRKKLSGELGEGKPLD